MANSETPFTIQWLWKSPWQMFLFWKLTLSLIYILKLWIFASWKASFATLCKLDATATLTLIHQHKFSHSSLCSLFFHFHSISKQWSCDNEQLSILHHNTCRVFFKELKGSFHACSCTQKDLRNTSCVQLTSAQMTRCEFRAFCALTVHW